MMKDKMNIIVSLCSLAVFLLLISNASAKLALDNDCPVDSFDYVNFSNSTSIFLPFTYNELDATHSNLTIFLGTNTNYFCNSIDDDLPSFASGKHVIFTPEFLEALKTSSCSASFETYIENFKKSGDILSSSGSVFCGLNNATLSATTIPSGVTFTYPYVRDVNISSHLYSNVHVKKYLIAYLMNNPSATYSGILKIFSEAVDISVSASCSDVSTKEDFFNAGKGNFTEKFSPLFLDVDYTSGEELKPAGDDSGLFGWLVNFILGNKIMPIIKVSELSSDVYLCGLVELEADYLNNNVTAINNSIIIDSVNPYVVLDIKTSTDVTNATIEIAEYPENPHIDGALRGLGRYVGIRTDHALKNAISSVIIKVYYTDSEVSAANLIENTLRIYYYNESSGDWEKYDNPDGGVNTAENYVWANTTHFSDWSIFGDSNPSGKRGNGGGNFAVVSEQETVVQQAPPTPVAPSVPPKVTPAAPSVMQSSQVPSAPAKPSVPLNVSIFSIIAGLMLVGIIVWTALNKKETKKKKKKRKIRKKRKIKRRKH